MKDNAFAQALALAAQLGFTIACPMLVFIAGGAWLDSRLGTVPWLLFVGIFLGLLTAGGALYQLTTIQTRKKEKSGPEAPYKVEKERDGVGIVRADKQRRNRRRG